MDRYLSDAIASRRFSVALMAAFAIAAFVLALVGIYAVVMYAVSRQARDIGIRLALGASPAHVVRLVLGNGLRFVLVGILGGLVIAAGVSRLLSTMLFGLTSSDVPTFAEAAVTVASVSLLACAVPTVRLGKLVVGVLKTE
jgi:putative ABC transport system permease protein